MQRFALKFVVGFSTTLCTLVALALFQQYPLGDRFLETDSPLARNFGNEITLVQDKAAGDNSNGTLKLESVTIEPYTGPPILLEEGDPPLPAAAVETRIVTDKYADGKPRIERGARRFSDNRIVNHGPYKEYYPNGQLFLQAEYDDGEATGEWTYFYDNGQVCRKINYESGLPSGAWDVFREDGTLLEKRSFQSGKRHGEWQTFDESGSSPVRIFSYRDGIPHGIWKDWFPNGVQHTETEYKDGKKDGLATEWDAEGTKRQEINYKNNLPHGTASVWNVKGQRVIREFNEGRLVSSRTE